MASPTVPKGPRTLLPLLVTAVVVFALDQLSKAWANGDWIFDGLERCAALNPRPTIGLCLAYNEGMAFSIGWGAGALIAPIAVVIVVAMLVFAPRMTVLQRVMMGAIVGGAIGNLVDRAFRVSAAGVREGFMGGAVVDFFYSSFFATFNVADAAIVVGGFLLAFTVYRMPDDEGDGAPAVATPAAMSGGAAAGGDTVGGDTADGGAANSRPAGGDVPSDPDGDVAP